MPLELDGTPMRDRAASKIEVTDDMIAAGLGAYYEFGVPVEVTDNADKKELFSNIFIAMAEASRRRRDQG
ncbi:MAG: hypothetical protein KGL39_54725 [Patescibacteria group bacterium]|nr:hypothetical protein [Patescibacteria group bacterium]